MRAGRLGGAILAATALWCTPPAAADNYPRQPDIDVQHYLFRLTLNDENDEIAGETTATIRMLKDGVAKVTLDLASPAGGRGMSASDVSVDRSPARFTH